MSITASGLYGLTTVKQLNFTSFPAGGIDSETAMKGLLVDDTYTPNFDTHAFRSSVTNEVSGTGYTTGGVVLTTTTLAVGSPSAGVLKYDHDDPQWASSTITNAMALVEYYARGGAATADELHLLLDFVTAVSTSNGLLLVSIHANGAYNLDYTP